MNKVSFVLASYAVGINVGSIGLFFYDKQQAINHQWRVPEKTLHLSGLLGGWLGGMFAMEKFKHKRSKQSFKNVYFTAVAANIGIIGASILILKKFPQYLPNQLKSILNVKHNQYHHQHQNIHRTTLPNNNNNNNISFNNNQNSNQSFKKNKKKFKNKDGGQL